MVDNFLVNNRRFPLSHYLSFRDVKQVSFSGGTIRLSSISMKTGSDDANKHWWSPISCTLIQGPSSAVLVDTPISIKQTEVLAAWIKQTAPEKQLKFIYTTHAHEDH